MACGQGIQLRLDVIASAGQGSVLQGAGGHQLVQRASPGLHLLGLVLSAPADSCSWMTCNSTRLRLVATSASPRRTFCTISSCCS